MNEEERDRDREEERENQGRGERKSQGRERRESHALSRYISGWIVCKYFITPEGHFGWPALVMGTERSGFGAE